MCCYIPQCNVQFSKSQSHAGQVYSPRWHRQGRTFKILYKLFPSFGVTHLRWVWCLLKCRCLGSLVKLPIQYICILRNFPEWCRKDRELAAGVYDRHRAENRDCLWEPLVFKVGPWISVVSFAADLSKAESQTNRRPAKSICSCTEHPGEC